MEKASNDGGQECEFERAIGVEYVLSGLLDEWVGEVLTTEARRYFRFFNFIDSFDRAYHLLVPRQRSENESKVIRVLDFGKFSALGIYVFLEDLTIVRYPPGHYISFTHGY